MHTSLPSCKSLVVGLTLAILPTNAASAQSPIDPNFRGHVCFDAGTPPAYVAQFNRDTAFNPVGRWSSYAVCRGLFGCGTGSTGWPVTLLWSIAPDAIQVAGLNGEPTSQNNLTGTLNAQFGNSSWRELINDCFAAWDLVSGLDFQECTDDGRTFWTSGGVIGVAGGSGEHPLRGDIRIAMHPIDGPGGILAYAQMPDDGDIVLDSAENWASPVDNFRFFRQTLMHEIGHAFGLGHVCPSDGTKLMEIFHNQVDGPTDDDIRAVQRLYGDPFEESVSDTIWVQRNDQVSRAYPLSYHRTHWIDNLSLDSNHDDDYFTVPVGPSQTVRVTVRPVGKTYPLSSSNGTGSCGASPSFDSLRVGNLQVELMTRDGQQFLAVANGQGPGGEEAVTAPITVTGQYLIHVSNQGIVADDVQRYVLGIEITPWLPRSTQVDAAQTWNLGPPNNEFFDPVVSADGSAVVFHSLATNLVPGGTNNVNNPATFYYANYGGGAANNLVQVNLSSSGTQGSVHAAPQSMPAISPDGSYVLFPSASTVLAPGNANGMVQLFKRNIRSGVTEIVTLPTGGGLLSGWCGQYSSFSAMPDGRHILFYATATNLTGATPSPYGIYTKDLQTGAYTRVTVPNGLSPGSPQAQWSDLNAVPMGLSFDGRDALFGSSASYALSDTNNSYDLYIRSPGNVTDRVSVAWDGTQRQNLDWNSWWPSYAQAAMSSNARRVVFAAQDPYSLDDSNNTLDIFVRDRLTCNTIRASRLPVGQPSQGYNRNVNISGNGRWVLFYYSDGSSTNQYSERMYAYDLITGRALRVGDKDGGASEGPFMSSGSTFVGTLPYIGPPSYDGSVAAVYMHGPAGKYLRVCDLSQSASIGTPAQARIGQTTQVPVYAPGQPNRAYLAGAALSTSPGIPLGSRYFPLAPDFLLSACWSSPGVFQGFFGSTLDANGKATPSITIPAMPGLVGITFATSFLTLDPLYPTGFGAIAPAVVTAIVR